MRVAEVRRVAFTADRMAEAFRAQLSAVQCLGSIG